MDRNEEKWKEVLAAAKAGQDKIEQQRQDLKEEAQRRNDERDRLNRVWNKIVEIELVEQIKKLNADLKEAGVPTITRQAITASLPAHSSDIVYVTEGLRRGSHLKIILSRLDSQLRVTYKNDAVASAKTDSSASYKLDELDPRSVAIDIVRKVTELRTPK